MDNLFGDQGIRLAEHGYPRPLGRRTPADWREYELEEYMRALPVPGHKPLDLKWWIPHKTGMNRRPTWDLLCHILVKGKPGLLLVEAKAHVGEMSEQDKKSRPTGSNESQCNDRRIRHNISETNTLLSGLGYGQFSLSVDHHYQLANRIAYLSKLARDGIPVVLSYLGWLKSPAWPRDFFRDRSDWEEVMRRYTSGVLPGDFPGKVVQFENGGSMQMLVRSLEVEA
ncbi:MAG TPA: hypothetical protein VNH11_22000 [Pirellulales bacterium]|nr:hypothetical protein [Pirellulales bacterium]